MQRQLQASGQMTLPCAPSWESVFTHLASETPPDLNLDAPLLPTCVFPGSERIAPVRTDSVSPPGHPEVAFSSDDSDSDSAETAFESALSNISCGEFDEAVDVPNIPLPFAPTPGNDASTGPEQQPVQDSVPTSLPAAITAQPLALGADFASPSTATVKTGESGASPLQSPVSSRTFPPGLQLRAPNNILHDGLSQLSPTPQDVPVRQTRSRPLRAKIMSGLPFRRLSTSALVEECGDSNDSRASSIFKPILKTLSDSSASSMTTLSALAVKSRDVLLRRSSTVSATGPVHTNTDAATASLPSASGVEMSTETPAVPNRPTSPIPFPLSHRALSAPAHGGAHGAWVPRTPSRLSVAISSPVPRPSRTLSTPASVPRLQLQTPVCETSAQRTSPASRSPRTLSTPASAPRLQLHTPVYDMPVQRRLSAAISSPSHRLSVRAVSSAHGLSNRPSVGGSPATMTALSSPRPLSLASNRTSFHMDIVPQWESLPTSEANGLPSLDEVRNFLYPARSQIFPSTPIGARDSVSFQRVAGYRQQNAENVGPAKARNVLRKAKSEASMSSRKKLKAFVLRVVNGEK